MFTHWIITLLPHPLYVYPLIYLCYILCWKITLDHYSPSPHTVCLPIDPLMLYSMLKNHIGTFNPVTFIQYLDLWLHSHPQYCMFVKHPSLLDFMFEIPRSNHNTHFVWYRFTFHKLLYVNIHAHIEYLTRFYWIFIICSPIVTTLILLETGNFISQPWFSPMVSNIVKCISLFPQLFILPISLYTSKSLTCCLLWIICLPTRF